MIHSFFDSSFVRLFKCVYYNVPPRFNFGICADDFFVSFLYESSASELANVILRFL